MDLKRERLALQKADAEIVAADERIERQRVLLRDLERDAHDTAAASALLMTLEEVRRAMVEHRQLILRTIGDIEKGLI
jgi:hypothetical protein